MNLPNRMTSVFVFFFLLALVSAASFADPFGPTDFDAVFSDQASVQYQLNRTCLANTAVCLDEPGLSSVCRTIDSITGQRCATGIHRFCLAKGHSSGFGVENALDSSLVDITCMSPSVAEVHNLTGSDLTTILTGCSASAPNLQCAVLVDRYCRQQPGLKGGFGPVERSPTAALVTCVEPEAFNQIFPLTSAVEALVPGCTFGATVSTACRQAMDLYCSSQDPDLTGGFGPGELGTSMALGCVEGQLPWTANSTLPESPSLPVDILSRRINDTNGVYSPELVHNSLGASRSLSFDTRLAVGHVNKGGGVFDLGFVLQTPEIFDAPLSQVQPSGNDRSFEVGHLNFLYRFDVPGSTFHNSTGGQFFGASTTICDPHQGSTPLVQENRQQSVPSRVSNPFACNASGTTTGTLDHDCYDVSVVTVYNGPGNQDELWGTPVRVVVTNPKGFTNNGQYSPALRARVVDVQTLGPPAKSPFPAGEPEEILEPTITGDGRLIIIQGDGMIRYSVMSETDSSCDVTKWTNFKHLYEMHSDPMMADYGIAKYPIRDFEGAVIDPNQPGDQRVRGAYPWVDRDGDNLMFMLGHSTLFYIDSNEQVHEKFEVVSHPFHGTASSIPCGAGCTQPLHLTTPAQVMSFTDGLPRLGMTFVGLWTQGKMFSPDSRNNAVDLGLPGNTAAHRNIHLYSDVPEGTEVGTSIRTSISSSENQLFFHPELRPDTPREVVWVVGSQEQTDEVDFDDVIDPRALIVSSMGPSIIANGQNRGRFQDGFVNGGKFYGEGFQFPSHVANQASAVSEEVVNAAVSDLSANVQWNIPSYGYLLGGARVEPIAAGGIRGKGLWLDGADDRLDYIVPRQPSSREAEMSDGPWFYNISLDPRDLSTSQRLLTLPDGSWLDIQDADTLRFGRGINGTDVNFPLGLTLQSGVWSTLGILSTPSASGGFDLHFYLDGYLFETVTPSADYFRVEPGRLTLGAETGGFKGWIDEFKVLARDPGPEVICNHARGTLIGVETGDPLESLAGAYPASSHGVLDALLPTELQFPTYACERPIANPTDAYDLADHSHYKCLGQTRRLDDVTEAEKCLKHALLFPEGPQFWDVPRVSSQANAFCLSCHVDSNPSITMGATDALAPGLSLIPMHKDTRRQPMQNSPKIFGYLPTGLFGTEPTMPEATPVDGKDLDPYTTPESP